MKFSHPRIIRVIGNSVSEDVASKVRRIVSGKTAMIVLDSDHRKEHVLREMEIYGGLVTRGYYLVVEDTNLGGHPVRPLFGPGPMEAVRDFFYQEETISRWTEKGRSLC